MKKIDRETIITALAEYYAFELSDIALQAYAADLGTMSDEDLLRAIDVYKRNPRNDRFPIPFAAKLRDAINPGGDGRPGAEEAWAMMPKDESKSVVWTAEMAEAFSSAAPLLVAGDEIAARMAFRERYILAVATARAARAPVTWSPSFGSDPAGRELAIRTAVDRKRLSAWEARKLLPTLSYPGQPAPLKLQHGVAGPDAIHPADDPAEEQGHARKKPIEHIRNIIERLRSIPPVSAAQQAALERRGVAETTRERERAKANLALMADIAKTRGVKINKHPKKEK